MGTPDPTYLGSNTVIKFGSISGKHSIKAFSLAEMSTVYDYMLAHDQFTTQRFKMETSYSLVHTSKFATSVFYNFC